MIYTVTFNPSLDYIVRADHFAVGEVNRTIYEQILEGGKGLNVSVVLKNMGLDSVALGFTAGFTGEEIERRVAERGVRADFVWVEEGMSRINVKLKAEVETELNGQGPHIEKRHIEKLYEKLEQLKKGDILVLAGSIPNTLPDDMYERIMERLDGRGIRIVVDATRELLTKVLPYHPFLIKPNHHELGEIFSVKLSDKAEIASYAKKLQAMGAGNVLVSMAGDGAVLVAEDGTVYECPAPRGKVVNSVGAGDSMVAGFLTGYLETGDYQEAFLRGVATGSASAFSEQLATREEAEALLSQLKPEAL